VYETAITALANMDFGPRKLSPEEEKKLAAKEVQRKQKEEQKRLKDVLKAEKKEQKEKEKAEKAAEKEAKAAGKSKGKVEPVDQEDDRAVSDI
jgi:hypothetical protein